MVQAAEPGDALGAGPQHQVIGVGEDDVGAGRRTSSGNMALTVAPVPTGMKAGVRMIAARRGDGAGARLAVLGFEREGKVAVSLRSRRRAEQAGIAIGIEAIARLDGMRIGALHQIEAGEGSRPA